MKMGELKLQESENQEQSLISSCTFVQDALASIHGFINAPNYFISIDDCRVWTINDAGYIGVIAGYALTKMSQDIGTIVSEVEKNAYLFFTRGDNDYLAIPLSGPEITALLQLDHSSQTATINSIEKMLFINGLDISPASIIEILEDDLTPKISYVSRSILSMQVSVSGLCYSIKETSPENNRITEGDKTEVDETELDERQVYFNERQVYIDQLTLLIEKKQQLGEKFILRAEVLGFCPADFTRRVVRAYNHQQTTGTILVYLRLGYIISQKDTGENQLQNAPDFLLRKSMEANYLYQHTYCNLGGELRNEIEGYKLHFLVDSKGSGYKRNIAGTTYTLVGLLMEEYIVPVLLTPGELNALQGEAVWGVDLDTVTEKLLLVLISRIRANLD